MSLDRVLLTVVAAAAIELNASSRIGAEEEPGAAEATPALAEWMKTVAPHIAHRDRTVRKSAMQALAAIGTPALPALEQLTRVRRSTISKPAEEILESIRKKVSPDTVGVPPAREGGRGGRGGGRRGRADENRPDPAQLVERNRDLQTWLRVVTRNLTTDDAGVRRSVTQAFAAVGEGVMPFLRDLGASDKKDVSAAAAAVIADIENASRRAREEGRRGRRGRGRGEEPPGGPPGPGRGGDGGDAPERPGGDGDDESDTPDLDKPDPEADEDL